MEKELNVKLDKLIGLLIKREESNLIDQLPHRFTKQETAEYLHISVGTLDKLCRLKQIQHYNIKGKVLFSKEQIMQFFEDNLVDIKKS